MVDDVIQKKMLYAEKCEYQRSDFVQSFVRGVVSRFGYDLYYKWQVDAVSVCMVALKRIFGFSRSNLNVFKQEGVRIMTLVSADDVEEHLEWRLQHLKATSTSAWRQALQGHISFKGGPHDLV